MIVSSNFLRYQEARKLLFLFPFFIGLTLWFEASKLDVEVDSAQEKHGHQNHIQSDQKKSLQELDEAELTRIEQRFLKRRARLKDTCLRLGHPVVNEYSEIVPSHFYFPNTLFDDKSLDMSGCILPRTGTGGWNSFWYGSSEFDKTGRFSSFQAQGNKVVKRDQWEKKLKENKPKVLFLTARHPIQRLISVWNRRFCYGTCSNDQDRKLAKQSLEKLQRIYGKDKSDFNELHAEFDSTILDNKPGDHMMPFSTLVDLLVSDLPTLDSQSLLELGLHTSSICHPCDIPYNYIVKLETFAEDYQYIMKNVLGLWNEDFTAKHKQVGITVENAASNLDYEKILGELEPSKLNELVTTYQNEMEMFGYQFDSETLQFQMLD